MGAEASQFVGLSPTEVAERREQYGANELPTAKGHGLLVDVVNLLREPMSLLLLICGVIYAAIGDRQEAFMLLGFVIFIMALTLIQERKTGRALAALRDLASPRALVTISFFALVIYLPPLARLFRFAPLGLADVGLCFGAAALSVAWFEVVKRSGHGRRDSEQQ